MNGLGFNVLAEPTAALLPLEVLGQNANGVLDLGPLSAIWTTTGTPPAVSAPQPAAAISGGKTGNLSLSLGLNLLSGIVGALGGSTPGIAAAYSKASTLQFSLGDVTSLSVVLADLGSYLENGDIDMANPLVAPYFNNPNASIVVVHEVLQATSVSVTATDQTNASLAIDPGALSQIASGKLTIQPSSNSGLTYTGTLHIAYGNGAWPLLGDEIDSNLGTLGAPAPTSFNPILLARNGLLSLKRAFGAAV